VCKYKILEEVDLSGRQQLNPSNHDTDYCLVAEKKQQTVQEIITVYKKWFHSVLV
jgi:hypothetical protein